MNSELEIAEKELLELKERIKNAGAPPHTDFWHQSLNEAEEKVKYLKEKHKSSGVKYDYLFKLN